MKALLIAIVAMFVAVGARIHDASACSTAAPQNKRRLVFPVPGGTAVPLSKIWVVGDLQGARDTFRIRAGDIPIEYRVAAQVRGSAGAPYFILLEPIGPLLLGSEITVAINDQPVGAFTVSNNPMQPRPVRATAIAAVSERSGAFGCGSPSSLSVETDSSTVVFVIDAIDVDEWGRIGKVLGAGKGGVSLQGLPSGQYSLRLYQLDTYGDLERGEFAANVTIPEEVSGCSTTGSNVGILVALIVGMAFTRNRRRELAR